MKLKLIFGSLVFILGIGGYFYYDNYYDSEIIVISPIKYPFKTKAPAQDALLSKETDKLVYQNFETKTNIKSDVYVQPGPEEPLLIKKDSENSKIFELAGDDQKTGSESVWDAAENEVVKENTQGELAKEKPLKITRILDNNQKNNGLKNKKAHQENFYSQLGYYRSSFMAKGEWEKMKQTNKKHLSSLSPIIRKVKKKTGEYHFELLVGPYKEFKSAKYLCKKITKMNQKCIVVKN